MTWEMNKLREITGDYWHNRQLGGFSLNTLITPRSQVRILSPLPKQSQGVVQFKLNNPLFFLPLN
jgi:hypothetical protein